MPRNPFTEMIAASSSSFSSQHLSSSQHHIEEDDPDVVSQDAESLEDDINCSNQVSDQVRGRAPTTVAPQRSSGRQQPATIDTRQPKAVDSSKQKKDPTSRTTTGSVGSAPPFSTTAAVQKPKKPMRPSQRSTNPSGASDLSVTGKRNGTTTAPLPSKQPSTADSMISDKAAPAMTEPSKTTSKSKRKNKSNDEKGHPLAPNETSHDGSTNMKTKKVSEETDEDDDIRLHAYLRSTTPRGIDFGFQCGPVSGPGVDYGFQTEDLRYIFVASPPGIDVTCCCDAYWEEFKDKYQYGQLLFEPLPERPLHPSPPGFDEKLSCGSGQLAFALFCRDATTACGPQLLKLVQRRKPPSPPLRTEELSH